MSTLLPYSNESPFGIPKDCPFSIRLIDEKSSTYLIRERDKYGDFPNIYARVIKLRSDLSNSKHSASLIILSDTGSGTNRNSSSKTPSRLPSSWNLSTFLAYTINPNSKLSYLVITTHCHYDHILGLNYLPSSFKQSHSSTYSTPKTTVLASAYDKSFITPHSHLAAHSLCNELGIPAPHYAVGIWAEDLHEIAIKPNASSPAKSTGITILQTPGHTPDSLSWYDASMNPPHIFVGDSFNERQSEDARNAPWGREPPMPTMFDLESDLLDWWGSMAKVIRFVRDRNEELRQVDGETVDGEWLVIPPKPAEPARVRLGAAHVTVSTDAENCLLAMRAFVGRILRGEVPCCRLPDERGFETWLWDDLLDVGQEVLAYPVNRSPAMDIELGRFSVKSPLKIVQQGREKIPKYEWCK